MWIDETWTSFQFREEGHRSRHIPYTTHTQTHTDTCTQTHAHRHTHRHMHRHTHRHTEIHAHINTETHTEDIASLKFLRIQMY